jgi:4-methyl-5(b-hydroxyethyl)-thiazole monophosphate biosynthesis
MKAVEFLVTGFEEIEAITPIDVLRRGQVSITTVSLTGQLAVTGSHGVTIQADRLFDDHDADDFDMLILPGGPGTSNYKTHDAFLAYLKKQRDAGKIIAAICAAPTVLGMLGFLKDKSAVCYTGMENELTGAILGKNIVETDGNIITSKGPATALFFALKLLEIAAGADSMNAARDALLVSLIEK